MERNREMPAFDTMWKNLAQEVEQGHGLQQDSTGVLPFPRKKDASWVSFIILHLETVRKLPVFGSFIHPFRQVVT